MILHGVFRLLSPLSHIGESISTDSYLNEEPIIQPDGSIERVFVYNGNAWRGQLRDLMAMDLCEQLGVQLPLPAFHLLFSGGSIGDSTNIDLEQARELRRLLPMVSLLGGGVGNQILPGRLVVGNSYPICRETAHLVPQRYHWATLQEYRLLTCEKSFTRTDDGKHPHRAGHLDGERGDEVQQMRYHVELLAAGATLYTYLLLDGAAQTEVGALMAALNRFRDKPHIGGQASRGHGRCALIYEDEDGDPWYSSEETPSRLDAVSALEAYLDHVTEHRDEILGALRERVS